MPVKLIVMVIFAGALAALAMAQTAPERSAAAAARPLQSTGEGAEGDKKAGGAAVSKAPAPLQREGTYIFDRAGRLARSADGSQAEFTFTSNGKAPKDPPVIMLPNLKLMTMEDVVRATNRDLLFRVTGMLTEYRGRNYLLVDKVVVPPEPNTR